MSDVAVVDRAEAVEAALQPVRRRVLAMLRAEADSATGIARRLGLPRQQVNYHLRELERHGLVSLVAERQRRGCTERVMAARGAAMVDPGILDAGDDGVAPAPMPTLAGRDRLSADVALTAGASIVHEVGRMAAAAAAQGRPLVTATLVGDVHVDSPEALRALLDDLAAVIARHDRPRRIGARAHRVTTVIHPTPATSAAAAPEESTT